MRTPPKLIASLALASPACVVACAPAAMATPPPAMTVAVHPASGAANSYFTLSARGGRLVRAGTLELRNRLKRPVIVRLDPVGALTASTLGSAYRTATSAPGGQARWIVLPMRRIVLGPHGKAMIPVGVRAPAGSSPGDYLSGISVEAVGQARESRVRGNIAISNVQRYAVGLFVKLPGPRHSLIRIPTASVEREPAGLTFYVHARNEGNTILQNVRGSLLVTRGHRTVARTAIGPGTFVSGTSIAYPQLAAREQPREGAVYRVRAVMRYAGGVARLDTRVRFGHASAETQQDFGGPPVEEPGSHSGLLSILAAVVAALAGIGCVMLFLLLRRRRVPSRRAAMRALDRALATARASGEPLSLIRVANFADEPSPRKLAAEVRARLRRSDSLYRLARWELLVIAPDTRAETAKAVGSELQRHLARTVGPGEVLIRAIEAGRRSPVEALERLRQFRAEQLDEWEISVDSLLSYRSGPVGSSD
jgi:hypothetical protein